MGHQYPPIRKDLTDGGMTATGKGKWHFLEAQGWRNWTFQPNITAGTFSADIEVTTDPSHILADASGNILSGAEGSADVSTVPASKLITGITGNVIQTITGQFVAVRVNLTAISGGGTFTCPAEVSV